MQELCGLTLQELRNFFKSHHAKPFHADQMFDWLYKKGVHNLGQMTTLDKGLRRDLSCQLAFPLLQFVKSIESADKETVKFLWRLRDNKLVESVLICSHERRTVCVSSQVGCPARCAFCASGQEGLVRNLTTAEIVEQVLHIDAYLAQQKEKVTHVVYMGMGEPLENVANVVKSVRILHDPKGKNLSMRRITISTVGVIEGIDQLLQEGIKPNLVLSLHAPDQKTRQKIIPYARKYELGAILRAMDEYCSVTKRDPTFEYTLIAGINDSQDHAHALLCLLRDRQCTVNLIPYNPVEGRNLSRPKGEDVHAFASILQNGGVHCTWRYTKGVDIAAACGQLALKKG